MLDVDPHSIQQTVSRQESFEQNDDRRYTETYDQGYDSRDRYPRPSADQYDSYAHHRSKQGRVEVITSDRCQDDDDEDGEWC